MTIVTNENIKGKGGKRKMKREKHKSRDIPVPRASIYPLSYLVSFLGHERQEQ